MLLSWRTDKIEHPLLLTECPCNPLYSRSKMAELLFETYNIPSLGKFSSVVKYVPFRYSFDLPLKL